MDHGAAEWRGSIYYQDDHEQDATKIPGIRRSPHLLRTVIVNPGEADWAASRAGGVNGLTPRNSTWTPSRRHSLVSLGRQSLW